MRAEWMVAAAAGLLAAGAVETGGESMKNLMVSPGTVVRWSGEGIEACSSGGKSWKPVDGVCYFPIDLTATGTLAVSRTVAGTVESRQITIGPYPYPEQRLEVPERMVHLSPHDQARVERENRLIGALWGSEAATRFSLPLTAPLDPLPAGGRFGSRRVFNGEPRSPHSGADFPAKEGASVTAVADGVVALSGDFFFSGNSVFVDHGGGLVSMYFHLSRVDVRRGQSVHRGQTVGLVGATGRALGPHLHFGVRWHGARVDPTILFAPPSALPDLAE